jgi:hypothetical protein
MNQPSLIPISDRGNARYELEKDYSHRWYAEGHAWLIQIPAGFRLDGASVPWIGTVLTGIQRDGLHRAAALVHDWIYRHAGQLPIRSFKRYSPAIKDWMPMPVEWTREQADKLFANMLAESGVSKFRRRTMYLAVRAFGWRSWKPKT